VCCRSGSGVAVAACIVGAIVGITVGSVGQCAGDSGAEPASAAHIVIEHGDFGLQGVPLRHIGRAIGAGVVDDDDAIRLPGIHAFGIGKRTNSSSSPVNRLQSAAHRKPC
jgi:hypothetical protein